MSADREMSIAEMLAVIAGMDHLDRVAMAGPMKYAQGILRGSLEAVKASRAVIDARIAEAERRSAECAAQDAMSAASNSARLVAAGVPLEVIHQVRQWDRAARH